MRRAEQELIPRREPLEPRAVLAFGPVAQRLMARVLEYSDVELAQWTGVTNDELVVLLGDGSGEAVLPWVDGVIYLGSDPRAPGLFVPTAIETKAPLELVARSLLRRSPPPLAVSLEPPRIVPLVKARRLSRALVEQRVRGGRGD